MKEDKNKIKEYEIMKKKEIFKTALQLLTLEAQLLSNIFTAFLIAHSIIIGALITTILNSDFILCFCFNLKVFLIGLVGVLLSLLWLFSYLRGSSYYSLRITQAYENEPKGWFLYDTIEDDFSNGKAVKIGDRDCRINYFGRLFNIRIIMIILILVFLLSYTISVISFGPWF